MNKPLLLLVCDFLLLSMFALARFDVPADAVVVEAGTIVEDAEAQLASDSTLIDILEQSLAMEKLKNVAQSKSLEEAQHNLALKDSELNSIREGYEKAREDVLKLNSERQEQESKVSLLQESLDETKSRMATFQSMTRKEKEQLQNELKKKERDLIIQETRLSEVQMAVKEKESMLNSAIREQAMLEQKLVDVEETVDVIQKQKEQLEKQSLQLARRNQLLDSTIEVLQVEKNQIASNLADTKDILSEERDRNKRLESQTASLTSDIQTLATQSEEIKNEITQELRKNIVMSPHEIFQEFLERRVDLRFEYTGFGLVGNRVPREKVIPSVLFRSPTDNRIYTIFHIQDSPLEVRFRIQPPLELTLWLDSGNVSISLDELGFLAADPNILIAEVLIPPTIASEIPEPFNYPSNPLQYDEALVIQGIEDKYGESRYSVVPEMRNILRLENGNVISSLLGNFKSRRGNLVFSRGGDFMGLMRSSGEAVILSGFEIENRFMIGAGYDMANVKRLMEDRFEPIRTSTPSFPRISVP